MSMLDLPDDILMVKLDGDGTGLVFPHPRLNRGKLSRSKRKAPTPPINEVFSCVGCQISATSTRDLHEHMLGRKHQAETDRHMFKYDIVHGQWKHHEVKVKDEKILLFDGKHVTVFWLPEPKRHPMGRRCG
ncbi:hypothetical protein L1987_43442 [Smallanthus sonchifolius]|uniref:Uncharacterized protein n=1 Tax=Smallanthus sonchifolius TaxID=185202 RepID=A0ACB9GL33_9ASTR|nr:hypothetical protein L1987_43442 [Smallanthus sonchifolius]